jgi:aspartyl aminopeptidase
MLEKFFHFLNSSPTGYHAVRQISEKLAEADFSPLFEEEKWQIEPGKSYFLVRDGSLLAAFRVPKKRPRNAVILASHLDSPALKIKPKPECTIDGIGIIGTESYGAPILHTWFDRNLAIAGRIVTAAKNGKIESKTVFLDDYPLIIPSVAIHLNREVNEKGPLINKQDHLRAILSISPKEKSLEDLLRKHISFHQLLSFDLYLVPTEKASSMGSQNELISSYRIDNLSSAFASLDALLKAKPTSDTIQMAIFWDNEEIGSQTFGGADSLFANHLLERICAQYKMDREEYFCMKARSLCLSCDVSHAWHPNFSEKYDPQNTCRLGKGPVVKYSPRYATNAASAAPLMQIAKKRKILLQTFASRSDLPSGGTVGAMMGANLGIPTVDLGIGCWAMHSIRETISWQDQQELGKLLKAGLEEPVTLPEDL